MYLDEENQERFRNMVMYGVAETDEETGHYPKKEETNFQTDNRSNYFSNNNNNTYRDFIDEYKLRQKRPTIFWNTFTSGYTI